MCEHGHCALVCTNNGDAYRCGNTDERAKHRVLGARVRGLKNAGKFNHANGTGHVPHHDGDYHDAINKRKAHVELKLHGTGGGMSDHTSKSLYRAARAAKDNDCDGTKYGESVTAKTFVPFYAQKLSWCAIEGSALAIKSQVNKKMRDRLHRKERSVAH